MKIKLLVFVVFSFILPLLGQSVKVTSPATRLETGANKYSFARLSPDGKSIAAAGENFSGLFLLELTGKQSKKLSDADGIGWNFAWSPSGNAIAGRSNVWNANLKTSLKTSKIVLLDLQGNILSESAASNDVSLPFWSPAGGSLAYFDGAKGWQVMQTGKNPEAVVAISNGKIHVFANGAAKCENFPTAVFTNQVLNIAWSPSGARACIQVAGQGLYVYECANNTVYDLGYGEFPCWLDDEYFAYSVSKDDGYRILSSNIMLKKYNGNDETNLTKGFTGLAMYPSCTGNGDIIFTTDSGDIYKLTVTVSR